jgi:hypothetical protein
MTPPERSEWTVTEASKRQFGAALWPPGMQRVVRMLPYSNTFHFLSGQQVSFCAGCAHEFARQERYHKNYYQFHSLVTGKFISGTEKTW